ncbi:PTS sugar transporter subunit IIA [Peloplasma aerotolerans]|uniref:Fructose PTS transporter subunit IIA n=1 Tax=Peloplasma aerotolerans TaxID=3044389 RepID=A0AAW6U8M4_9MOLU|nr:fructose PTS transporter subunit IIA [Mariniplasma sp. M4Ah]MDI6453280.1 fructose PTS transporter subunit IIA [Mariniplasma sp. M4Ah]
MKVKELINNNLICLDLDSQDKESVIKELIDILDQEDRLSNVNGFLKDVMSREKEITTGIGYGIAIPHAKSKHVKQPALVFGKSQSGIDFESLDQRKAQIFFLIAIPEDGADLHLKILAKLSRKLMDEHFRYALMISSNEEQIMSILNTIDED